MKKAVLSALVLGILFMPAGAAAGPIGFLSLTNGLGQGLTLSSSGIDFLPSGGDSGSVATGALTEVIYAGGGPLLTGMGGLIRDIGFGSGSVLDFLTFTGQPDLRFDLLALTPGGAAQGALDTCAGVTAIGVSCSPFLIGTGALSPFVLTNRGFYTELTLGLSLLGRDLAGTSTWMAGLTTQAMFLTPDAIQTRFNSGQTVTSTFSAMAASVAGQDSEPPVMVPEPATASLALVGLTLTGLCRRRSK